MLRFPLPAPPTAVGFSPDGRLVGVAAGSGVTLFDAFSGRPTQVLLPGRAHAGPAAWLHFAPDGLRLAARHAGVFPHNPLGVVNVWSTTAGRWLCELPAPPVPPAFLPDGRRLVAVGGMTDPGEPDPGWCRLWFWAALSGDRLPLRPQLLGGPLVRPVGVFAPAGEPLCVVQADRVRRFAPDDLAELHATRLPDGLEVTAAAAVAGGVVVAAERTTGRWLARRWVGLGVVDADGFRPAVDLVGRPERAVWAAAPDGRQVVRAEGDRVEVFHLGGGYAGGLDPGLGPVRELAVSADGLRVAAAGRAGVAVWDADG